MDIRDVMITDKAFRSLRNQICLVCGWTKPRLKTLCEWQKQESKELSQQRGIHNLLFFTIQDLLKDILVIWCPNLL